MDRNTLKFSVVSTIFNEEKRLEQTIGDIEAQTINPTEIVITDAGSTDGTWEILTEWRKNSNVPIVLLKEEGCNVARGRNLAIKAAKYELIVSTDFGCRFHPEWLQSITTPYKTDPKTQVVGGNYTVCLNSLKTNTAKVLYILNNGYSHINDRNFLPSSRSISYKKSVWTAIGGYPEDLTLAGDDTKFAQCIHSLKIPIVQQKEPFVYWLRHDNLKDYAKEAQRYGLGDGENKDKRNLRNAISNSIELICRYAFLPYIFFLSTFTFLAFIIAGLLLAVAARSPFRTYNKWRHYGQGNLKFLFAAFLLEDYLKLKYLKGYLKGLKHRRKTNE